MPRDRLESDTRRRTCYKGVAFLRCTSSCLSTSFGFLGASGAHSLTRGRGMKSERDVASCVPRNTAIPPYASSKRNALAHIRRFASSNELYSYPITETMGSFGLMAISATYPRRQIPNTCCSCGLIQHHLTATHAPGPRTVHTSIWPSIWPSSRVRTQHVHRATRVWVGVFPHR